MFCSQLYKSILIYWFLIDWSLHLALFAGLFEVGLTEHCLDQHESWCCGLPGDEPPVVCHEVEPQRLPLHVAWWRQALIFCCPLCINWIVAFLVVGDHNEAYVQGWKRKPFLKKGVCSSSTSILWATTIFNTQENHTIGTNKHDQKSALLSHILNVLVSVMSRR